MYVRGETQRDCPYISTKISMFEAHRLRKVMQAKFVCRRLTRLHVVLTHKPLYEPWKPQFPHTPKYGNFESNRFATYIARAYA